VIRAQLWWRRGKCTKGKKNNSEQKGEATIMKTIVIILTMVIILMGKKMYIIHIYIISFPTPSFFNNIQLQYLSRRVLNKQAKTH
jgi:hypothetical protein